MNRKNQSLGNANHVLSIILKKVSNIERLLTPDLPENIADNELLDTRGVRLLTKMSDRTILRRRNDGTLPFVKFKGKIYYRRSEVLKAVLLEKSQTKK